MKWFMYVMLVQFNGSAMAPDSPIGKYDTEEECADKATQFETMTAEAGDGMDHGRAFCVELVAAVVPPLQ